MTKSLVLHLHILRPPVHRFIHIFTSDLKLLHIRFSTQSKKYNGNIQLTCFSKFFSHPLMVERSHVVGACGLRDAGY